MASQEFIAIPKEKYTKQQSKTLEVLDDATINEKAKIISLLQRQQKSSETVEPDDRCITSVEHIAERNHRETSSEVPFNDETMADRKKQTGSPENI